MSSAKDLSHAQFNLLSADKLFDENISKRNQDKPISFLVTVREMNSIA